MSTVQDIEAVLPKLSRAEIEEVRALIDDLLEDRLELTDEVKARLERSRQEHAQKPFAVTPELEAWLLESADKPAPRSPNLILTPCANACAPEHPPHERAHPPLREMSSDRAWHRHQPAKIKSILGWTH